MKRPFCSHLTLWILSAILVLLSGLYYFRHQLREAWTPTDERTNFILIVLDDLDWDLVADEWLFDIASSDGPVEGDSASARPIRFPHLHDLAKNGLVFTNFHSTTPVCGPARASILSGQYASRHRVRVNRPGHATSQGFPGGFAEYGRSRDFARQFQAGRYQTCFVGKYVHDGFEPDPNHGIGWSDLLPYGWDRFHACMGAQYNEYWAVDSASLKTKKVVNRFRTDYEADQLIALLDEQAGRKQAQLVCWFALAPHDSTEAEVAYPDRLATWFTESVPPVLTRRQVADRAGWPQALHVLPRELSPDQQRFIQEKWMERLRSVKAFDENLGRLRDHLREQGRLDNTVFLITSDHGFRLGDQGHVGKRLPYDPITRVPLLISGKGVRSGRSHELLANIDLAPTLIELAGVADRFPGQEMDGRSFAALLAPNKEIPAMEREDILLEGWEAENAWGKRIPAVWTALRTRDRMYTEWADGSREYYHMDTDPWQLENRVRELSAAQAEDLQARLSRLRASDRPPLISLPTEVWQPIANTPQNPCFSPIRWHGFVDADSGIDHFGAQVFDPEGQVYWDGQAWTSEATELTVRLDNRHGLVSRWEFELQLPERTLQTSAGSTAAGKSPIDGVAERVVTLTWRAQGRNGKRSEVSVPAPVRLRLQDPETWFDPLDPTRPETSRIRGWAVGHGPLRAVRLVIRDSLNQTYWNGESWVAEFTQVNARLGEIAADGRQRWEFEYLGTNPNPLFISARAVDRQGNFDQTVAVGQMSDR